MFGRKRKQRLLLVAASAILWGSALLLYGCTSSVPPTETPPTPVAVIETVTVMPETATAYGSCLETATATLVPTAPPSPLVPSPTPKLTITVELVQAPPTAGRIAFHSARSGELDIYVMNADGTDLQRLTNSPGRDFEPDWSPDGKTDRSSRRIATIRRMLNFTL